MARDSGIKSRGQRRGGSKLWIGILAGTLIGLALAAGVVWYEMRSANHFIRPDQVALAKPQADQTKSAGPLSPGGAPGTTNNGKPRFEFYNVLTKKQNVPAAEPSRPQEEKAKGGNQKPASNKASSAFEPQILQAGSFSEVGDAEKLRAKLALIGYESNIQTVTLPDRGVRYRVRLGPYTSAADMTRASSDLKQNGVDSTPIKVQ